MKNKILTVPEDEEGLVELKNEIAENNVNLAKMNTEVESVYDFM